jgi:hypothetical protein
MGFRGWDGYQHPCCGVAQYNPQGQFVIHDCLYKEGVGVQELIEEQLLPLLVTPKYESKIKIGNWRDIGDPSMATPDQSTVTKSGAKYIETKLKTRFEKGPTRWKTRMEPLNYAIKRSVNVGRAIIISASAVILHRALNGGWHYKTNNNGDIVGEKGVKDEHSHPGEMLSYLIAKVMPHNVQDDFKKVDKEAKMQRALSYGGSSQYQTIHPPGRFG